VCERRIASASFAASSALYRSPSRPRVAARRARPRRPEWVARWAIPVPDHTPELGCGIRLETWYGHPVAEIVHQGPFGEEEVQEVKRLQRFITDCGYQIAGDAEEEYVTRPGEEP
jgi:hypothetical protein